MTGLKRYIQRIPDWTWLILIAGAVRVVTLGSESLWYDEAFTSHLSQLNLANMWRAILGDVHPPLWYLVSWLNVRILGTSDFSLRFPAMVFSIAAVLLVRQIALTLKFDRRSAFIAGVLAAILPASIYYGQDARMYPMLSVFILGAILAALCHRWVWFSLCAVGACYTQNLGVLYILVLGGTLLLLHVREIKRLLHISYALSGIMLAWLPWLTGGMSHQLHQISQGFWIPPFTVGAGVEPLELMTFGARLPGILALVFIAVSVVWTSVGIVACRRWLLTRNGILIFAAIFGTPMLTAAISVAWRSIYLPRAFLPSTLLLCLVWAWPTMHMAKPNRKVLRAVVVPALAIAIGLHYSPAYARPNIKQYSTAIRRDFMAGDVIFYPAVDGAILFTHYLSGLPYFLMPESNDLNQSLTDETKAAMQFSIGNFNNLSGAGFHRVWLVSSVNPLSSAKEMAELDRIKATYCYVVVWQEAAAISRIAIELVDLQCHNPL
jgi:4-amino-4-deoxy-L-arabinose transferase-like glycosyltransferase